MSNFYAKIGAVNKARAERKRRGVHASGELDRIIGLPRRVWSEADAAEAVELLTEHLTTDVGKANGLRLRALQAIGLAELADIGRGVVAPWQVGEGKTLFTLLIATVLDTERTLLIVPSRLRGKTHRALEEAEAEGWRIEHAPEIRGSSEFSVVSGADLFDEIDPDVLVIDEAHEWASRASARTKRFARFLRRRHREGRPVRVVPLSGTLDRRSIRDSAALVEAAMGSRWSPLPVKWADLDQWSRALDEKVKPGERLGPGVLEDVAKAAGDPGPREWLARRCAETPGYIVGDGRVNVSCSLVCRRIDHEPPEALREHIQRARDAWEDPNGKMLTEAVQVWALVRQLSLGYVLRWDPEAPEEWLDARRVWAWAVRDELGRGRAGMDSPKQVANLAKREGWGSYAAWVAVRDTFKPSPVADWLDDSAIDRCAEWLHKHKGIAWVEGVAFGQRLAARAGVPYRGAGPAAAAAIDKDAGPIVASIRAHGTGRNLQIAYGRNLITSPPAGWDVWEQLLGRTHRQGQPRDEVIADVLITGPEALASWQAARNGAVADAQLKGQDRRLGFCDRIDLP